MDASLVVVAAGVLLLLVWVAANRRHLRRRDEQADDWSDAQARPDLWTSSARCPSCGSQGGLLELDADQVWLVCLACGKRHPRETRG